ncbi:MAG: ATP-binding protein [Candidatus Eisenbacteria bacterium]|uniref:ATP-binding protein n=1 Tax=Eiseniibacteriota bacterium TaxID=2212470 RepID=A0A956NCA5_UNCEI|nr:ATP-binding protein [Candidatus Eisenbacteria bacterium]
MGTNFERQLVPEALRRLQGPPLIQILLGPRQVGKTTAARQIERKWEGPVIYATADSPLPPQPSWIETHWDRARRAASEASVLLILDEVQKVEGWSETVKALWDADRHAGRRVAVLLLGSSALLLSRGTSESLAGRFFVTRCLHWSYAECRDAFGWDLDRWLFFGGYPGTAPFVNDENTWKQYVTDSLIETVISRDVVATNKVAKPTLLRHLFVLASRFPSQILSYNKMLGQLQDAGNTTTLSNYVRMLESAYLLSGLERYSAGQARSRGSSPKLVLWNNALVTALGTRSFESSRNDPAYWGRLVENAVGAHLLNELRSLPYEVTYWRERNDEVDFVVRTPDSVWGLEVKSGRPDAVQGLEAFRRKYPGARTMVIGGGGMPLEEFFERSPMVWL